MTSTTYLVTGANKGLGGAIVTALLLRPDVTIIAAVRNPDHETTRSLQDLPRSETAQLITVKIDSSSRTDHEAAVKELQSKHGIKTLDVVIANAGIINSMLLVREATVEGLLDHYNINTVSTVLLYQATRELLLRSKNPKFIATSGSGGSIAQQEKIKVPLAEYGPSRAALNWLVRKVHFEEERLVAVLVDPGLMDTETVIKFGMKREMLKSAEECAENYLKVVDNASKETTSGTFVDVHSQATLEW